MEGADPKVETPLIYNSSKLEGLFFHIVMVMEWCGFYNKGFPSFPDQKHMFWRQKWRQTHIEHFHQWHTVPEEILMETYVARNKDINRLSNLKESVSYDHFFSLRPKDGEAQLGELPEKGGRSQRKA